MDNMDLDSIKTLLTTTALAVGLKILAALAFWLIGRWLIGRITAGMRLAMNRNSVDPMLVKYLGSVVGIILNVALVIGILGYFGIETTSFAALLAGAGLAIGAAWSGMLGNFAAGAFMLVLRPFKIGDFVTVAGITGTVHELGLFGTTLITPDNVLTVIGNGKIFAEVIQNYSAMPVRRVERTAQLAGGVDADGRHRPASRRGVTHPERRGLAGARSEPAGHEPRRPGDLGAAVRAHGSLLAGVLRHQRGDRPGRPRSGLAGADADPDRQAELIGRQAEARPARGAA